MPVPKEEEKIEEKIYNNSPSIQAIYGLYMTIYGLYMTKQGHAPYVDPNFFQCKKISKRRTHF